MIWPMRRPAREMIGTSALRNACLPMTLASDRPPARNVLTKSWLRFSSIADRVMRTVRAIPSIANTTAGRMSWRKLQHPAEGSHPSTDANNQTASNASQKLGTAMPATEKVMIPPSHHELRRNEARIPSGTPIPNTRANAAAPRMRLFLPCVVTRLVILALFVSETPGSPVRTRRMYRKYCS